jgi:hypothetical protein
VVGYGFSIPLQRGGVRYFAAEFVAELVSAVGEDLGIVASTGSGHVSQTGVDELTNAAN